MNVIGTEVGTGGFGNPSTYTLSNTPVSGNSLLVAINVPGQAITTISDSGGNTWVEDFATDSDGQKYFRCQSIGTVPTTLTINFGSNGTPWVAIIEVDDLAASPLNVTTASTALGFGTVHTQGYTTSIAGELVFAIIDYGVSRDTTGASGTNILQIDTSEARCFAYKNVASAETGNINFSINSGDNPDSALVSYQPAAAASSATLPLMIQYHG